MSLHLKNSKNGCVKQLRIGRSKKKTLEGKRGAAVCSCRRRGREEVASTDEMVGNPYFHATSPGKPGVEGGTCGERVL